MFNKIAETLYEFGRWYADKYKNNLKWHSNFVVPFFIGFYDKIAKGSTK